MIDETTYSRATGASSTTQDDALSDPPVDGSSPSIWRRNLLYILLTLAGGILVGTPFVIFAIVLWGETEVRTVYPRVFLFGGISIIVGPAALTVLEVWCNSRRLISSKKRPT